MLKIVNSYDLCCLSKYGFKEREDCYIMCSFCGGTILAYIAVDKKTREISMYETSYIETLYDMIVDGIVYKEW